MPRKKKRRIIDGKITFLSLCALGKNRMRAIYKADGTVEFQSVIARKMNEEGELTALVYVPDHADTDGDFADAVAIKRLAHSFAESGLNVDIRHNMQAVSKEQAFVAESFIVQQGDPRFSGVRDMDGNEFDPTNSWAVVVKILDPELRRLYREGAWTGVSMFGDARVQEIEKSDNSEEPIMDEEKLAELLTKSLTEAGLSGEKIGEAVREAVSKAVEVEKPQAPEFKPPAFEGEYTAANLKAHAFKVQKARVTFDASQPGADFAKLAKAMEEIEKAEKADSEDKSGRQPSGQPGGDPTDEQLTALQKEHQASVDAAVQSAMLTNPRLTEQEARRLASFPIMIG